MGRSSPSKAVGAATRKSPWLAPVAILAFFFYFVPVGLWITALFSGVRVGLGTMIGMRLRKVPPGDIVRPLISATKAGLDLRSPALCVAVDKPQNGYARLSLTITALLHSRLILVAIWMQTPLNIWKI